MRISSHGDTDDERAELRRAVHARQVDPRVPDWLGVLAGAEVSIDAVFVPESGAEPVRALVAARGRAAVLAVQDAGGLTLRPIEPTGLVWTIIELLPAAPRGSRRSVSVPSAEFGPLGAQRGLRGGQFAANGRDRAGVRRRSPVLAWFDDDTGRYLGQATKGWTTVAPADAPALRKRISEMMTSVTDGGR